MTEPTERELICRACGNADGNGRLRLPGDPAFGEDFDYCDCARCGSLSLTSVPDDVAKYYGEGYYSFNPLPTGRLHGWIRATRSRFLLTGRGILGGLIAQLRPNIRIRQIRPVLQGQFGGGPRPNAAVVDVGCGAGRWLSELAECGLTNLTGIDPFMADERPNGLPRLLRRDIHQLGGGYDLVIASHSLEHVADPVADLRAMRARLNESGVVMIRIPLAKSFAWERFGPFWVQLDAPRHVTLFTLEGFARAAEAAGLTVRRIEFDSTAFAILGSELRAKGVGPHSAEAQQAVHSRGEIRAATREAERQNRAGRGDQATFYLTAV